MINTLLTQQITSLLNKDNLQNEDIEHLIYLIEKKGHKIEHQICSDFIKGMQFLNTITSESK